jgi:hypothetical protein
MTNSVPCSNCGKKNSFKPHSCPYCGYASRGAAARALLARILISLALLVGLWLAAWHRWNMPTEVRGGERWGLPKEATNWAEMHSASGSPRCGYTDFHERVWIVHPRFEECSFFSDDGLEEPLAAVKVGGRWGYMDQYGVLMIKPAYLEAQPFFEGLAAVKVESGLWGYVDQSGGFVIQPSYTEAKSFRDGKAVVTSDKGVELLVDKGGQVLCDGSTGDCEVRPYG